MRLTLPSPHRINYDRVLLVILAALIALVLVPAIFVHSTDKAAYGITTLDCRLTTSQQTDTVLRRVTLPYSIGSDMRASDRQLDCTADIALSERELGNLALLVPSYGETLDLKVNGHLIANGDMRPLRNLRYLTLPALYRLDGVAKSGLNRLELRVSSKFGRDILLDRMQIGPYQRLAPQYSWQRFLVATLPTMTSGATLALALLFGLVWASRRNHTTYGWLAILLFCAGVQGSILIPDFLPPTDRAFWALSSLWAGSANVIFLRRLFGLPRRNAERFVFIPSLIITLFVIAAPRSIALFVVLPGSTLVFLLYGVYTLHLLGRASLDGHREAQFFLLADVVVFGIALHDVLISANVITQAHFYSHSAVGVFMIGPALMMIRRTTSAMNAADRTAETLRLKIAEVEQELLQTYETLSEQREALLINQERSRMMRDLHDGLSGDIASMMALAERNDPDIPQIARHARNALADMRLIISSLEDYGDDLSLALGAWRERMEPQVRAAGIKLEWDVADLPSLTWLSPSHVLDILRILQEAITNALRHSGASAIHVKCGIEGDSIEVVITDNGCGRAVDERTDGRGIANMRARSRRLGAGLSIEMPSSGTRLCLSLPLVVSEGGEAMRHGHA